MSDTDEARIQRLARHLVATGPSDPRWTAIERTYLNGRTTLTALTDVIYVDPVKVIANAIKARCGQMFAQDVDLFLDIDFTDPRRYIYYMNVKDPILGPLTYFDISAMTKLGVSQAVSQMDFGSVVKIDRWNFIVRVDHTIQPFMKVMIATINAQKGL